MNVLGEKRTGSNRNGMAPKSLEKVIENTLQRGNVNEKVCLFLHFFSKINFPSFSLSPFVRKRK